MLAWKLRIAVLWIFLAVCQSAGMALLLFEPGAVRDLMGGTLHGADVRSAEVQINTALYWLAPMVMAYLTLVLRDAANRTTNALLGAGAVLNGVAALATHQGGTSAGAQFVGLVGILVALLIVWHAWKWPRQGEDAAPRQRSETKLR